MKNLIYFYVLSFTILFNYSLSGQGMWINNRDLPEGFEKGFLHIFNNNQTWEANDGLVFPVNSTKPIAGPDQQGMVMYLDNQNSDGYSQDRGLYVYYNNNWHPILSEDNFESNLKSLSARIREFSNYSTANQSLQGNFHLSFNDNSYIHNDPNVFKNSTQLASTAPTGKYLIEINVNTIIEGEDGNTGPSLATLICYKNTRNEANKLASTSVNIPNPGRNDERRMGLKLSTIANLSANDTVLFSIIFYRKNSNIILSNNPTDITGSLSILNLN